MDLVVELRSILVVVMSHGLNGCSIRLLVNCTQPHLMNLAVKYVSLLDGLFYKLAHLIPPQQVTLPMLLSFSMKEERVPTMCSKTKGRLF